MTEKLVAAVGESLLAIGLYTIAFESMVLSFRGGMHDHLKVNDPESLRKLLKACSAAHDTFRFCTPVLLQLGVIKKADSDALTDMRKRRNKFSHEGYNEVMSLSVADVESDVLLMYRITGKVERWRLSAQSSRATRSTSAGTTETRHFSVSPAIFGMYLQAAKEISYEFSHGPLGHIARR